MGVPQLRLILASSSPRRQDLLTEAGFFYELVPAEINEDQYPTGLLPGDVAAFLAQKKADVVSARHPDAVVLAADTIVSFGDQILGKPKDPADAKAMLTLLSGTTHLCITGVAVQHRAVNFAKVIRVMSAVRMRPLTEAEIDQYVAGGEWQGKAGGYGIQDADPFVMRMSGSHTNIVGLPMDETIALLKEAGVSPGGANSTSGG